MSQTHTQVIPPSSPNPSEESMHDQPDAEDESMASYNTNNDQPDVQGNSRLDFDQEMQPDPFQGPPTIAKLPSDNVFEQLE